MKDWLVENATGTKDAFEQYFKTLPADVRKVSNHSNFPLSLALTLVYVQVYKDRANVAVRPSILHD